LSQCVPPIELEAFKRLSAANARSSRARLLIGVESKRSRTRKLTDTLQPSSP